LDAKAWFFVEIMVENGKHGQGTHSTKMGADRLVKNIPNAPEFICSNCLPKPNSLGFL
jgi:hypothetical protein